MLQDYKIVSTSVSQNYAYFKLLNNDKYYFMKKVRVPVQKVIISFNNEVSKYYLLNNLNIFPKMLRADLENLYIICEYLEHFSKEEIMELSYPKKIEIILKIIDNVIKLHNNNIIHCDLKLSNIIVTKDFKVYLLDLDHACIEGEINNYGTLKYCSLAQINKEKANVSFDIYALGIIMYELLTNKKVYENMSKEQIIISKKDNNFILDDDSISLEIEKIIFKMLNNGYSNLLEVKSDLMALK